MAESIEYSSIVKFINSEIIQEKLAHLTSQAGGMSSSIAGDLISSAAGQKKKASVGSTGNIFPSAATKTNEPLITFSGEDPYAESEWGKPLSSTHTESTEEFLKKSKGYSPDPSKDTAGSFLFNEVKEFVGQAVETLLPKKMPSLVISAVTTGLATAAYLKYNKQDEAATSVMTGLALLLAMIYGKKLLNIMLEKAKQFYKPEEYEHEGGAVRAPAPARASTLDKVIKGLMYAAIIAGFGVVITELAGVTDYSARFYSWLSGSGSKASFAFDATTGNIVVIGSANSTVKLNSSSHFGIEGIQMVIAGSEVTYKINGTPLNAVSYIEGKPVHTALVMAYLVKDKHYNRFAPQSSAPKSDAGYVYTIEDDGSVRLFEKTPNGTAGAEVASINTAIRKQLDGNDAGSKEARKQACEKTFGVGVSDSVCSAHFYNILGKSGLGMLENMATAAKGKQSVEEALISAPANIKYEILKNLDWKMRVANGKKEMASVDQWVERLEQDARPAMKELAGKYRAYFKDNSNVKNILDKMVMDINNNTRLLDEKYKEAVQTPQPPVRRRRARLSAAQVADLRSQVLTQNVALNAPMALPGYPGVNLIELGPFQMGGASNQYEQHFENIKQSLAGFNQKLSSDTDRKIKAKISEIGELNAQLESIHKKINEYTKILRTEKYPTGISRTITLSDVENLVNQYKAGTQEQTKQIVTLSTAFGKIKMLLEKQEANAKPAEKNFLFDL